MDQRDCPQEVKPVDDLNTNRESGVMIFKSRIFCLAFIVFFLTSCSTKLSQPQRSLAIATSEPLVNAAAAEIFQQGGSLADAAVAASFAISVVRPQSTGIGGGGFLIFKSKDGLIEALDFRETAPHQASPKMYVRQGKADPQLSLNGPLAVATPGLVAGLFAFHQRHGKLAWTEVLAPSIHLARGGFPISEHMARAIQTRWSVIQKDPEMMRHFSRWGQPLKAGDVLIQEDLAQTLQRIAEGGAREFYQGETSQRILKYMKSTGGILSAQDLAKYQVVTRKPLEAQWKNYRVVTMPPPSSGGLHLLQILKMTEIVGAEGSALPPNLVEIEAFKRAYADRAIHLGDPDFHQVPVSKLLSEDYLKARAVEIRSGKILPGAEISPWREEATKPKQTSHISLMDSEGNVISTTQTVNYLFGAAVMPPGTGIVLNDEMDDFSIQPGVANVFGLVGGAANEIRPLKRPLSSMTPTIVFDDKGESRMVIGAPGGSRIITSVYKVIAYHLRDGFDPGQAMEKCRFHHQWSPDVVLMESRCQEFRSALETIYPVEIKDSVFGEVQLVGRSADGKLFAVADPRGHGQGRVFTYPQ